MANEFVVKNGLHVPFGAVGTPSIAFSGETTTGIYRSAANTFGISSAGELRGAFGDAIALTPKLGSNFSATTTGVGAIQLSSANAFTLSGAAASSIYTANAALSIYTGTGGISISDDAANTAVNIATGAAVKVARLGSTNTTSGTTVQSGTSGTSITSTAFFSISASGAVASYIYTTNAALDIRAGTGGIYIGDDAAANLLRFGSGAAVKTVTIGSTNTTSSTTVQSGTGDLTLSSQDAFNLSGAGAAGTQSNIYTVNVGLNIYTGTGTLALSADATANTVNIATGAGAKALTMGSTTTTSGITIQSGGNGITITSPGNVSLTSSSYSGVAAKVSMTTDAAGWIKGNGVYFVPAGGTGLQALLQAIIATTEPPGTIILGYGTHTINWTAATTVNQEVTIIGNNATVNFSSTDADCCLYFSSKCVLKDIKFTGPASGWLATYIVRVNGARSLIQGCAFNGAPDAGTSYLLYVDNTEVRVDHCSFTPPSIAGVAAVDYCIELTANSGLSVVDSCSFYCNFAATGSIELAGGVRDIIVDSCYFGSSAVTGTSRITVSATSAYCRITNNTWSATEASIGRIITFTSGDAGGYHLVQHNRIAETATGTTRVSCIYIAQPYCLFDHNVLQTTNRDHGGAPDTNQDRAAVYILAHYTQVHGNLFYLGGTAQLGVVVRATGNAAATAALLSVIIDDNRFAGIDGNTASRTGFGIHVVSNATYRPARGTIRDNHFQGDSNTASYAINTLAGGNGADSWVVVGNAVRTLTGFMQGDWTTGAQEVIANNQAP